MELNREGSENTDLFIMIIDSLKVSLLPITHPAPTIQKLADQPPAVEAVHAMHPSRGSLDNRAPEDVENQKRVAVMEKLMGMNVSLIIEKDTQRVGFVYKTVDKATGEVVRVWPQLEVATTLKALADVDARSIMQGMMVDAKA